MESRRLSLVFVFHPSMSKHGAIDQDSSLGSQMHVTLDLYFSLENLKLDKLPYVMVDLAMQGFVWKSHLSRAYQLEDSEKKIWN